MCFQRAFLSRLTGAMVCLLLLVASPARAELIPAEDGFTTSLSGYVYCDINNNGLMDAKELRIPDVKITLQGKDDDGNSVKLTDITDKWGYYGFDLLEPGTYSLIETQPEYYNNGKQTLNGTVVSFTSMKIGEGSPTGNYNFGEFGLKAKYSSKRHFTSNHEHPPVPEPGTSTLLLIGAATLLGAIAKRRRR